MAVADLTGDLAEGAAGVAGCAFRDGHVDVADGVQVLVGIEGAEEADGQVVGQRGAGAGHRRGSAAMLRRASCSALTWASLSWSCARTGPEWAEISGPAPAPGGTAIVRRPSVRREGAEAGRGWRIRQSSGSFPTGVWRPVLATQGVSPGLPLGVTEWLPATHRPGLQVRMLRLLLP